jgi:hypothetical protein
LAIDRRFVPLLFVYLWLEQAVHQCERKAQLGESGTAWRQELKSVRYLAFLATVGEEFFAAYA